MSEPRLSCLSRLPNFSEGSTRCSLERTRQKRHSSLNDSQTLASFILPCTESPAHSFPTERPSFWEGPRLRARMVCCRCEKSEISRWTRTWSRSRPATQGRGNSSEKRESPAWNVLFYWPEQRQSLRVSGPQRTLARPC